MLPFIFELVFLALLALLYMKREQFLVSFVLVQTVEGPRVKVSLHRKEVLLVNEFFDIVIPKQFLVSCPLLCFKNE